MADPGGGVLILTASYGEGHLRAGQAVRAALAVERPGLAVDLLDFFEAVHPTVNRLARTLYVGGVRHTPGLYGRWYASTARIPEDSWIQRQLDRFGLAGLAALLERYRPAAVLCTFPIPAGVLSTLRRLGRDHTPSAVAVTDFTVHSQWLHSGIDRYFVAAEDLKAGMVARGLSPERVVVSGIPIDPSFAVPHPPPPAGPPRVMIMGGAYGMLKDAVRLAEALAQLPARPQVVVMAGRDRLLLQAARALRDRLGPERVEVHAFTRRVAQVMASCHLLVSKAGGLTVSESLALGLPMVIYHAIPGQEMENVRFLVAHGVAEVAHHPREVLQRVGRLLDHPEALAEAARRSRELGRPDSARQVARGLLELMGAGARSESGDRAG